MATDKTPEKPQPVEPNFKAGDTLYGIEFNYDSLRWGGGQEILKIVEHEVLRVIRRPETGPVTYYQAELHRKGSDRRTYEPLGTATGWVSLLRLTPNAAMQAKQGEIEALRGRLARAFEEVECCLTTVANFDPEEACRGKKL